MTSKWRENTAVKGEWNQQKHTWYGADSGMGAEGFWEIKLPAYRMDCICDQAIKGLRQQAGNQEHHMAGHRELLKVHEQGSSAWRHRSQMGSMASADKWDFSFIFLLIGCNCLGHRRADPIQVIHFHQCLERISGQDHWAPVPQEVLSSGVSALFSFWSQYQRITAFLSISTNQFCKQACESRYHRREQMLGHGTVQQCASPALECNFGYHLSTVALGTGMGINTVRRKLCYNC